MKTLFIGGIKSGKSRLAEAYTLNATSALPVYLATSDIVDEEMARRIERHQLQRSERFLTVEEPLNLAAALQPITTPVLIECISMWINNMLHDGFDEDDIFKQLDTMLHMQKELIFVINDVGSGVIPDNALARRFVDINGIAAQQIAASCDAVYHVVAGIATRIK